MPDPGGRARLRTDSDYLDFPGHEPCARRGSESLAENCQPILASYLSTEPDESVHVRVQHYPHAGTKAATSAALSQPAVTCRFWPHRLLGKMVRLRVVGLVGLNKFNSSAGALRAQRREQRSMGDEGERLVLLRA